MKENEICENFELSLNVKEEKNKEDSIENERKLLRGKIVAFWFDRYNFLLLLAIYMCLGLVEGYFDKSLSIIFTDYGASYADLSILTFINYPFVLKFLWAPLCDTYFISEKWKLGKRKTYIVISYYLSGVMIFVCAFYVNGWVYNLHVGILTIIGFTLAFLITFESIGTDAWSVAILHPDNVALASLALFLGQDIGIIIGYNLFIWLNLRGGKTVEEIVHNELLSSKTLFFIISSLFFIVGFITHFFKKETNDDNEPTETICEVLKKLKGFFKNKKLLFLLFVMLMAEFSFASIDNAGSIILIQKGFSTDLIDTFDLTSTFIGITGYFLSVSFSKRKKEWTIYLICILARFLIEILLFFVIFYYDSHTNNTLMSWAYGILINVYYIFINCYGAATYSFILRTAEGNLHVGGSFITVLACFSNFGRIWTNTLCVYLLEYMSFSTLTFLTWSYGIVFFGVLWKKIKKMEDLDQINWKLY